MRVLHVIDKSFVGGGQAAVRDLLRGFLRSGVETHLACRGGGPLVDEARALGTPVHLVSFDKRFRLASTRALASIVARYSIDVLHGHGLVATSYCTLARLRCSVKAPLIYHQHGFHHHNYGWYAIGLRKAAERFVCRRADRVVAASRADADGLKSGMYAPAERVAWIPYGITEPSAAAAEIEAAQREADLSPDRPVVGLVGRLHAQKGIDVFLKAAAHVAGEAPGVQFVVIGSGELERPLRALGNALGLDGALHWAGTRRSATFLPLMDVAVLSSNWEGMPLTLLEYMAAGRPIVMTDVAGCLDAAGPNEAEVVPRGDPLAMADAILRFLRSSELARARGAAARKRFLAEFTLPLMTQRVATLYADLVQ